MVPQRSTLFTMNAEESSEVEEEVDKLISAIAPFQTSNNRRTQVIDFIHNVIRNQIPNIVLVGCGSSALRCYLPESDLDLILFAKTQSRDFIAPCNSGSSNHTEVHYLKGIFNSLCDEIINKDDNKSTFSDMIIRNVEFINARTKVTHCIVNNIQVDVTVNQISSLKTLLFLEEADRQIGHNHLFKRSLLLIKVRQHQQQHVSPDWRRRTDK